MDPYPLDRPTLIARARRQRRVLTVAALLSGAAFVLIVLGIANALAGGTVHLPLVLAALIVGGTAVPAAMTARRLGTALRQADTGERA